VRGNARRQQAVRAVAQAELRVSVYLRSGDTYAGRPLHHEIVDRARLAGLRGATAVRGLQGFGPSALGHAALELAARGGRKPVLVEFSDDPTRVRAFLPVLEELIGSGLVVLTTVTTMRTMREPQDGSDGQDMAVSGPAAHPSSWSAAQPMP
jgi:uncharacterized protein